MEPDKIKGIPGEVVVAIVVATARYTHQLQQPENSKTIKLIIDLWRLNKIFLNIFMYNTTKKDPKDPSRKCCCAVDIAYKRALLYVWLPEVKSMFAQIVIDCQTKKETVSCEYCIVNERCHLRIELENKIGSVKEPLQLVFPLLIEA